MIAHPALRLQHIRPIPGPGVEPGVSMVRQRQLRGGRAGMFDVARGVVGVVAEQFADADGLLWHRRHMQDVGQDGGVGGRMGAVVIGRLPIVGAGEDAQADGAVATDEVAMVMEGEWVGGGVVGWTGGDAATAVGFVVVIGREGWRAAFTGR